MAPKNKPSAKAAKPNPKPKAGKKAPPPKKGKDAKKKDSKQKQEAKKHEFKCAVLVRNLDFEGMCHETVKEIFKNCGGLLGVRLRHGKYTLLFFKSQLNAKKALEMSGKTVKGNKILVIRARRARLPKKREGWCRTVWVGPLPGKTTKAQLRKHFESCGDIKKVRIYPSKKHGFVYFKRPEQALKAVAMAKVPFSHGKDVSEMKKVPKQLQWKFQVKLSLRTVTGDKLKNEKRFNRRPPSEIERKLKKSEARAALRAAAKAAKEAEKAKKGSSTKKGTSAKKDAAPKGSSTKKEVAKPAAVAKEAKKDAETPAKPAPKEAAAKKDAKPAPKEAAAMKEAKPASKKEAKPAPKEAAATKEAKPAPKEAAAKKEAKPAAKEAAAKKESKGKK